MLFGAHSARSALRVSASVTLYNKLSNFQILNSPFSPVVLLRYCLYPRSPDPPHRCGSFHHRSGMENVPALVTRKFVRRSCTADAAPAAATVTAATAATAATASAADAQLPGRNPTLAASLLHFPPPECWSQFNVVVDAAAAAAGAATHDERPGPMCLYYVLLLFYLYPYFLWFLNNLKCFPILVSY